jgi:hypothetical protein
VPNLRPTSILLGVLVDKLTFVALAVALAFLVGVESPRFQTLALIFGLTSTLIGAFAGAWHARHTYLLHGLSVGIMAFAISFSRFVVNSFWPLPEVAAVHPLSWELLGWTGAVLVGMAGGRLAQSVAPDSAAQSEPGSGDPKWVLWLPVFVAVIVLFAILEQL